MNRFRTLMRWAISNAIQQVYLIYSENDSRISNIKTECK